MPRALTFVAYRNDIIDRFMRAFGHVTAAIVLTSAALAGQQATPADRARAEAASQRATESIRALQRESEALAAEEKTLLGELRKLEVERELRGEEAAKADQDLTATRQALVDTTARIEDLRQTADNERPDVEARLVRLYKLGNAGYWRPPPRLRDLPPPRRPDPPATP